MSKLFKITLTSDIILDVATPTPGEVGKVLIRQNNIGFHKVELPDGHFGNITVEPTPDKTTLLEYIVDDTGTYWNSTILTPATDVSNPSRITNLNWSYLDATSVQINFTAPSGNQTVKADRYVIYYSNAPITSASTLNALQVYKNIFIPKEPGQTESFNLTKLNPKQVYYFAVVAQLTTFGKTRSGDLSNVINFTTLPLEGGGVDGTADIMIPIKAENVSSYYTLFDNDVDGVKLDYRWLVDYSNTSIQNNLPVGIPSRPMKMLHSNQVKDQYYNQNQQIIFDLEDLYTVDKAFLYPLVGSGDKLLYTSLNGTDYNLAATLDGDMPKNKWSGVDLLPVFKSDVRYIKIVIPSGERSSWNGIVFTGRRQSAQNIKGKKYKNTSPVISLPARVGTNSNIINDPVFTGKVAKTVRLYSNHVWYTDDVPKYKQGGGSGVTLSNIEYKFQTSNVGDSDAYYKSLKDNGVDIMLCMVGAPYFLAPADLAAGWVRERKPLDYGLPMELPYTTNPLNYKFYAQFYWQIAARYGNTTGQPDSLFRISPSDTIKKGLGYVKYFELGMNECTAAATSPDRHTNPEELAAIMSACYDGHKGAMGAGFGIKDADPTAIPVAVGLTSVTVGYKMAMMRWWDAHRGVGDYPIQFLNEHFYNVTGGDVNYENTYARLDLYGEPPEKGDFIKYVNEHIELRNSHTSAQQLKMAITEFGYDEAPLGSIITPNDPNLHNRGWKKALWTIRAFLIADYLGIDMFLQYAIFGLKYISAYPVNTRDAFATFATSGYLDGPNGAANRLPTQAYYYSTAFQKAMVGYKLSHPVRINGNAMSNELVARSSDPDLWVLAYKSDDPSKKDMLVMWLGNDSVTRTLNIEINVGGNEITVNTLSFEDLHNTKAEVGSTGSTASVLDGQSRKVTLAVTATPKILYTSNIGTGKLIEPTDITIQSLSSSQIKLAWTDKNLGTNNTRIYRSTNAASGFTQIYNGYIDNGEFTDSGLAEFTSYYYQIQFEKDGGTSNTSSAIGVQTLKIIAVPSQFTHVGQSPSTISLYWEYSAFDASFIDGFELWRSTEPAGVYTKVAVVSNNITNWIDSGLVANTTYYYKLRAYKGLSYGNYTATLNSTTDPITITPPILNGAETSYAGDRVTLRFSLPMADPSGLQSFFTFIEAPGSLNRYISATKVSLNPNDNTKVNIFLASGLTSTASTIAFSYDGVNGTLQSVYGIKANSISNSYVANLYNNNSLLNKVIKVNLTNDNYLSGLSDWNYYNLSNRSYNTVQYVTPVNDSLGFNTGYNFTMSEHAPESHIQNIIDVTPTSSSYFSTANTINSLFPVAVRNVGAEINGGLPNNKLIFSLMKLDASKLYNVKIYGWEYQSQPGILSVTGNGSGTAKTMIVSANTSNYIYLTNLKPSNITLPAVSATATADGYLSNKITINCTTTNLSKVAVQAMIIEEVVDN
jgi:hypothetical protein